MNQSAKNHPRVLVGCPTAEPKGYCLDEYAKAVKNLSYPAYDVLIADNSPTGAYAERMKQLGIAVLKDAAQGSLPARIARSRNLLRQHALENGYDYFLSLEQDVIPPADVIEKLLSNAKDIVTGIYVGLYKINGKWVARPVAWAPIDGKEDQMRFITTESARREPRLVKLRACGVGCLLISRRVLERIKFRSPEDNSTFDDIPFCTDAIAAGFELWADTHVQCEHLVRDQLM